MAPACPESPPPQTITAMSTLLSCSTTSSGCLRIILLVSRPKYSSRVRSLTTNSPEPGFIRTRAIDSLRRPVAETIRSLAISLESSCVRRFHGDGLLGGVGVLVARVDLQLLHQRAAEGGARQHAADGVLDEAGRLALQGLLRGELDEAARVHGVVDVLLVLPLLAREPDLVRVDHYHEVAAVGVRSEHGLVLAAQDAGDGGRRATEHLVLHVDDHPVALDGLLAAHHRLHLQRPREQKSPCGKPLKGGGRYANQPGVSTDMGTRYATRANRSAAPFGTGSCVLCPLILRRAARSSRRRSCALWLAALPSGPPAAGRAGRSSRAARRECPPGSATG